VLDAEALELVGRGGVVDDDLLDEAVHFLLDVLDEIGRVAVRALDDELDAAVGEILDVAADVVLEGKVLDGVAEADALDSATEMTGSPLHRRTLCGYVAQMSL
jgi:hypothetical protein